MERLKNIKPGWSKASLGVDFYKTFAPVEKLATVGIIVVIASHKR